MCGIIAYLGKDLAFQYLIEGLEILQNRGYDSAGIALLNSNKFTILKHCNDNKTPNSLQKIKDEYNDIKAHIGIGHTRWATHGPKTQINAHPHQDMNNQVSIVHNGIILNYLLLKEFLIKRNYTFKSETDTEVISNIIGYHLDNGYSNLNALKLLVEGHPGGPPAIEGTWGLVCLFKNDQEHLYISRNGSPIIIGFHPNHIMISSEKSALTNHVNQYYVLDDNKILVLGLKDIKEGFIPSWGNIIKTTNEKILTTPSPYHHWMLKEIIEQPISISYTLNMGGRIVDDKTIRLGGLDRIRDFLIGIDHLLIVAMGTSYHSALIGEYFFRLLKCMKTVSVIDASEFDISYIPDAENVGMICISQSGETLDVYRALQIAKTNNIITIGVVNTVDSLIARETNCGIYVNAGRENAVGATKSFTCQSVALILIAIWFAQEKEMSLHIRLQLIKEIHKISYLFQSNITMLDDNINKSILDMLNKSSSVFILGRQLGHIIAMEGALKIKEISYLHAEAYQGGSLKHGPFALIDSDLPVIILAFQGTHYNKMMATVQEVVSREAPVILITDIEPPNDFKGLSLQIYNDNLNYLTPLLSIVYLQYISYQLAILRGNNPDFPRNLAKVCTTD